MRCNQIKKTQEAQQQAMRAKAGELAAAASREVAQPVFDPSLALLLAKHAVAMTQQDKGTVFVNAVAALDEVMRKPQLWRMTLQGHTGYVRSAVFSSDGQRILTASWDNTARTWFSSISEYLMVAQQLIQRNPPVFTSEELKKYELDQ